MAHSLRPAIPPADSSVFGQVSARIRSFLGGFPEQLASAQVGTEPEHLEQAMDLAAIMSQMLITYGRTGNPNGHDSSQKSTQDGELPYWPAYDLKTRATMMWEEKPRIENDPRRGERIEAKKSHYHQAGTPLP